MIFMLPLLVQLVLLVKCPTELDGMNLTENAVKITNIQINKNYLCLIIQSEFVQQQFQDKTHQVAMPKLALERILSTLIPVCTITTQSAMVSKFVEMDSLINQIREEKEILAETVFFDKIQNPRPCYSWQTCTAESR